MKTVLVSWGVSTVEPPMETVSLIPLLQLIYTAYYWCLLIHGSLYLLRLYVPLYLRPRPTVARTRGGLLHSELVRELAVFRCEIAALYYIVPL